MRYSMFTAAVFGYAATALSIYSGVEPLCSAEDIAQMPVIDALEAAGHICLAVPAYNLSRWLHKRSRDSRTLMDLEKRIEVSDWR
jgi:hypothetical protein